MTREVQVCRRCLYTSDHPLGLVFDSTGLCSGCQIHEEKNKLDWGYRWERLERIVKPYRRTGIANYDCVIPVSGGGDSFFTVYIAKERLGLNPLLVTSNKYYNTPTGIYNLAHLRTVFNCDLLIQNINPLSVKKVIKTTFRRLYSFHWPYIAAQSSFPVHTAVSHKIPLIIWGGHQGLEQVGMFSHEHEVEMSRRYRKDHDLMGYEVDDLLEVFDTLNERDVWQFRYPDDALIQKEGVRGIYLGNFVRWDPLAQHQKMVREAGFRPASMSRTFDIYDHVDDWHYTGLHDWIKYKKHGYGKVTDQISREIRHGRISRTWGLELKRYYESERPRHWKSLLEWIGSSESALQLMFGETPDSGQWHEDIEKRAQHQHRLCIDSNKLHDMRDEDNFRYIVHGKGYQDHKAAE